MTFSQARNFLDDIHAINWGGCAISALALYEWLRRNNRPIDDVKLVYLYSPDSETFEANEKYFNGLSKWASSCEHACLLYRGKLYDSRGVFDEDRQRRYCSRHIISFTEKEFIKASLNSDQWNSSFDRDNNVPRIQNVLGVDLSEYM